MNELTVYGIPNCDTCRNARKWLDENAQPHRFHDLRKDGLDIQMLERWARTIDWQRILNKRSLTWRKVPENDRAAMTRQRAMILMLEEPTLVRRPVLECDDFVAIGFSPENYAKLFA